MNKIKLAVLAIVLVACGSQEGDTIETLKPVAKNPAMALRDSAMRIAYESEGDVNFERSFALLDEAMALDPSNKAIFYSKMQLLTKSGSQEEIFNMLVRLDTLDFKDPYSNIQLGVEYELRGEMEKANAKYQDAINIYVSILDTMQNTPKISRNNNVLNLIVAERLVQEDQQKLLDVINDDERQSLSDLISQIKNMDRKDLLEQNRKKMK